MRKVRSPVEGTVKRGMVSQESARALWLRGANGQLKLPARGYFARRAVSRRLFARFA